MTSQLEKLFMHWVFKNPSFFRFVKPHFFGNEEIRFIFECVLDEYNRGKDKTVPSTKEIITLVQSKDHTTKISMELLKMILKIDWNEYRDDFIIPRFRSWVLSNSTINGLLDSIELIKNVDKTDFDRVLQNVEQIKSTMSEQTSINLGDINIGSDFDDVDAHNQLTYINKITTGYSTLDTILNGGWDRKTLNILLAETGGGKSLWMQNLAVNAANAGYNVGYVTLELTEKKVLKRMGSIRLDIPISQYDELSKDREFMAEKIAQANKADSNGIFDAKKGKIFVKEYPAGSATVNDIEDWVKLVHELTGLKLDILFVDYIQIMKAESRLQIDNMLYLKGKHFAEGLRAIGQKYDLACISATQISKEKYGANDIALNDMPESKAIADTSDSVWASIRTPIMKIEGKYHLKPLKLRDSETEYERIGFDLNKKTLKIHNDHFIENAL